MSRQHTNKSRKHPETTWLPFFLPSTTLSFSLYLSFFFLSLSLSTLSFPSTCSLFHCHPHSTIHTTHSLYLSMEESYPPYNMHEQHNNTNTRPRSESWGNYHDGTSSRSRFLAKLKQRQQDDMPESPSAMTLAPSPSDGCNISSKQRKRPPLPTEMMQPEPFTPHHNNATCNQLSPPQESMMATPSISKKKVRFSIDHVSVFN